MSEVKTRDIQTSSIRIDVPDDYSILEAAFSPVIYPVPSDFHNQFDDVHIALHQQLTTPYRYWKYAPPGPSVYVLFPTSNEPVSLQFGDNIAEPVPIAFSDIDFHMIAKLLMEDYFRGDSTMFTGQGKYYQFARWRRGSNQREAIFLEIDIAAAHGIETDDVIQIFDVQAGARTFRVYDANRARPGQYIYYERTWPRGDGLSLQMLTREQAWELVRQGQSVWGKKGGDGSFRTRLEFFSEEQVETTRGYLLHRFCQQFSERLTRLGLPSQQRIRTFTRFPASKPSLSSSLDLQFDGANFYIFDARHRKDTSLNYYIECFQDEWFPDCHFIPITDVQFNNVENGPIIVLMDAEQDAYDTVLANQNLRDPYPDLYGRYPAIPLQGFNVNPNQAEDFIDRETEYLSYGEWRRDDEARQDEFRDFEQRIQVTLRDALLKHILLRRLSLALYAPAVPMPEQYIFVHGELYEDDHYMAYLRFSNGHPIIHPLWEPSDWKALDGECETLGVKWNEVENALNERRHRPFDQTDFLVVIGSGIAAEIVDVPEYALHDFPEVRRRKNERIQPHPVEYFLLEPHYDEFASGKGWSSRLTINEMDLEDMGSALLSPHQLDALDLLRKLQEHDTYIRELLYRKSQISLKELQGSSNEPNEYRQILARIGLTENQVARIRRAGGKFLNPRGVDVIFHTGLWFDEKDNVYMVGSPTSIRKKSHNAHRLRWFEPLVGTEVDIQEMLQLMAVGFVRLGQYTVLPYPFKLLRLYIENYLYWSVRGEL